MKKIICSVIMSIMLTGCFNEGSLSIEEFERFENKCDKNGGIELLYYQEINKNFSNEQLIVGVRCKDGATFRESYSESQERVDDE